MSASGASLDRMRANAAQALATGEITLLTLLAHVLAVSRLGNRPTSQDFLDAQQVAELVEAMNGFRTDPADDASPESQ